jgi:glucuronoarabinoxylan endo-1,4-beta-xylanase
MNLFKLSGSLFVVIVTLSFTSCGGDDPKEDPKPADPDPLTIDIDPTKVKQEMIGFGGALTWYSNWVTGSANKNAIADLMFTDLGIDIVRFKNWYYPDNYPTVKTTDVMTDDFSKPQWDATNELYTMAKTRVPGVKVLLSSWGPPASLKSNNSTRQTTGSNTLKKSVGGVFMYDEFADYWADVLDNVPFNPDYISIQNEPTFSNTGWTTCEWGNLETASLPDYHIAFNKVYDKIKNRTHVPIMIGPESQDVPTFVSFAQKLKDNPNCAVMAYHPYNINTSTAGTAVVSSLQSVGSFNTKPNIMTEFSDNLNWFNTALFIQRSLVYANSSGYIYWKLSWSTPTSGEDAGMVSVTSNGAYTTTKYFHLIKHFAKNIDAGYDRIETTSPNSSLLTSAFISPDGKKITLIIVNSGSGTDAPQITVAGKTIASLSAVQSKEGSYYKALAADSPDDIIQVPAQSITTLVININ